jgi:hypothetical protein
MVKALSAAALVAVLAVAAAAKPYGTTPLCGKCSDYDPACVSGTTCRDGLCKKLNIEAGLFCDKTCSLCKAGLTCSYGKCVAPPPPPPPPSDCGEPCTAPRSSCKSGLTCLTGTCKRADVDVGGSCVNSCESCKAGLTCSYGKCAAPPPPPSDCGEPCTAPGSSCKSGLTCLTGTCKRADVDVGGSCVNSCESCKASLTCSYGKCAAPPPTAAKCGESCGGYGSSALKCESGTYCYNSTCVKFVGYGQTCDDRCTKCYWGLQCNAYSKKCTMTYHF